MKRLALVLGVGLAGCAASPAGDAAKKSALFIGIDVSGSFHGTAAYDDALRFLAVYLYGRLNGAGDLKKPRDLFVSSIGGNKKNEAKSFRPIHDFQGKSAAQIEADLRAWYPRSDQLSDFNVFFREVADVAAKRNLALAPITVLLVTDGIPSGARSEPEAARYRRIDLAPLEYLSRKVTLRVLYPEPVVANHWETTVERKRVRVWTVDRDVMAGWKQQTVYDVDPMEQRKLWAWISDNVDYRVRGGANRRALARKP